MVGSPFHVAAGVPFLVAISNEGETGLGEGVEDSDDLTQRATESGEFADAAGGRGAAAPPPPPTGVPVDVNGCGKSGEWSRRDTPRWGCRNSRSDSTPFAGPGSGRVEIGDTTPVTVVANADDAARPSGRVRPPGPAGASPLDEIGAVGIHVVARNRVWAKLPRDGRGAAEVLLVCGSESPPRRAVCETEICRPRPLNVQATETARPGSDAQTDTLRSAGGRTLWTPAEAKSLLICGFGVRVPGGSPT